MRNVDINPSNDKDQAHGYHEIYWVGTSILDYKCFYKNDELIGYDEDSYFNSSLNRKSYHLI